MSYSESAPDSNFVINSEPNFDPIFSESKSESNHSESDFSSSGFFTLYLHSSK